MIEGKREHSLTTWLKANRFASDFERKSFYMRQQTKAGDLRDKDPDLAWLFARKDPTVRAVKPLEVLLRNDLPSPTLGFRSQVREGTQGKINRTLVKDDQIYLLRGDYPGLASRGIYSASYMRWNMTLDQFLLADKGIVDLEGYMRNHSHRGMDFVSATSHYSTARMHPDYVENAGSVYVLRMPLERVIINYASIVLGAWSEAEHLITDFVLPEQILAEIDPKTNSYIDVRDFIQ